VNRPDRDRSATFDAFALSAESFGRLPAGMEQDDRTIVALATPVGTAAIALVRVSGPLSREFASGSLFAGRVLRPRRAHHLDYVDRHGVLVDDVVVVAFAAPSSYTGEDGLEISCHGNPYIAQRIIDDLCSRGCRPALPGEFTQRAFLGGRMDLSQAEAVMDLIQAKSERSLIVAQKQLRGSLGRHLRPLQDQLLEVSAQVEAYIDFPEEDLPLEDRARVIESVRTVLRGTRTLLATKQFGAMIREGIRTVIVGAPNAGKSSLLNRLVGFDRALVSPEPGTTRDFLEEWIRVGPHALRLTDTAGLNPEPASEIERRGIERTYERVADADLVLWVVDLSDPSPALPPPSVIDQLTAEKTILVGNKVDLLGETVGSAEGSSTAAMQNAMGRLDALLGRASVNASAGDGSRCLSSMKKSVVSADSGAGFDALVAEIVTWADGFQMNVGDEIIAVSARHADALERARMCLETALAQLNRPEGIQNTELLASDLRGSLEAFGEILGKYDHEQMLDRLFATFCIGK